MDNEREEKQAANRIKIAAALHEIHKTGAKEFTLEEMFLVSKVPTKNSANGALQAFVRAGYATKEHKRNKGLWFFVTDWDGLLEASDLTMALGKTFEAKSAPSKETGTPRKCLKCQTQFMAPTKFIRLCDGCRAFANTYGDETVSCNLRGI